MKRTKLRGLKRNSVRVDRAREAGLRLAHPAGVVGAQALLKK